MPWRSDGRRHAAGFTLLELLVVLAVIGLATAVALPALRSGGAALEADARALAGALRLAREQAILTEREVVLTLDLETRRYAVPSSRVQGGLAASTAVRVTADADEATGPRVAVRFMPDGSSTGAVFALASGAKRRTVRVDWLTGRVGLSDA